MEPSTPTEKNFFGTPLGIFLAIIFFPFFFTYWIYKQNWGGKAKLGFMLVFWSLMLIAISANYPQEQTTGNQQKNITSKALQPTSEAGITNPPFDKNRGNNIISAKYAQQYMDFAAKTTPGAVKNVYLELSPADPAGKTDSFLTVTVNSTYWNIADDSTKKNLIAAAINELKNTFSGYPHITITDGTKTLATGELPDLTGEPKVTLK